MNLQHNPPPPMQAPRPSLHAMTARYPPWLLAAWGAYAVLLPWILAPAPSWRDGPEFIVAAWGLGIAHPSGFPLYAVLAAMVERLPFADIVIRNHAFSAVCTLWAAVLLYEAALSLFLCLRQEQGPLLRERAWAGWCSLGWLLMPPQIENAVQSEAYALFAIFAFLLCKLLLDAVRLHDTRRYVLAAFLAGLGCGNHIALGAFLFPLIVAAGFHTRLSEALKTAASGVLAGLAGLSVYLYLPVRSRLEPSLDWGNSETWSGFWRQVTDRKDAAKHFSALVHSPADAWAKQILTWTDWLGIVALTLAAVGWLWLLWRHPRPGWLGLSWAAFLFLFFIDWQTGTVLSPAFGMLLLGAAVALNLVSDLIPWKGLGTAVAVVLAAGAFLHLFPHALRHAAAKSPYLASELVRMQLLRLPYRATVLAGPSWFHLLALRDIEGLRPDVSIIGLGDIISPQFFRPLRPRHVPLLRFPVAQAPNAFSGNTVKTRFLKELMFRNVGRSRFYLDPDEDYLHVFIDDLEAADGFWWLSLAPHPVANSCRRVQTAFRHALAAMLVEKQALSDPEFGRFLQHGYFSWLRMAMERQPRCLHAALGMLKWWLHWMSGTPLKPGVIENDMGVILARIGDGRGARAMFRVAAQVGNREAARNLGMWLLAHGDRAEALRQFKKTFLRHGDAAVFRTWRRLLHADGSSHG